MADGLSGFYFPITADRRPSALRQREEGTNGEFPSAPGSVYARVSTYDQEVENQLGELRRFVDARGWEAREYVDEGISGAVEQRPALDELVRDAKRRRFDVLVYWRLDRLGRSLKHLITLLDDLQALGVAFVSLAEGIDATTPAGKLQMHILGAISEFERARIAERVRAWLARVRREGRRLGRPPARISREAVESVRGFSVREAARRLGVSRSTAHRVMAQALLEGVSQKP